jgi:ketosteroid isomerase-like protein
VAHPNEDLLRKGFEAFGRGDIETIRALLSPEAAWHVAGRSKLAGTFVGVDAILAHFGRVFQMTGGTLRQELHDVVAGDGHAVALVHEHAQRGPETLEINEVLVAHFQGGVVTEAWVIPQDQYAFDAFFS